MRALSQNNISKIWAWNGTTFMKNNRMPKTQNVNYHRSKNIMPSDYYNEHCVIKSGISASESALPSCSSSKLESCIRLAKITPKYPFAESHSMKNRSKSASLIIWSIIIWLGILWWRFKDARSIARNRACNATKPENNIDARDSATHILHEIITSDLYREITQEFSDFDRAVEARNAAITLNA